LLISDCGFALFLSVKGRVNPQSAIRNPQSEIRDDGGAGVKAKKTARIVCANDNEFWTTQRQFWQWVREGLVDVTGQHPLTGRFGGKREKLLVMIRHVVLDNASPHHKQEVLERYSKLSPKVTKRRDGQS
jgi:hypothetical protein